MLYWLWESIWSDIQTRDFRWKIIKDIKIIRYLHCKREAEVRIGSKYSENRQIQSCVKVTRTEHGVWINV